MALRSRSSEEDKVKIRRSRHHRYYYFSPPFLTFAIILFINSPLRSCGIFRRYRCCPSAHVAEAWIHRHRSSPSEAVAIGGSSLRNLNHNRFVAGYAREFRHSLTTATKTTATTTTRKMSSGAAAAAAEGQEPAPKRVKLDDTPSEKVIGTHSGTFQADEAMGVFMLRQLPEYRNSRVVRSRDPDALAKLDIVIDVGGIYDHDARRYDHHQRGYDERFDSGRDGTSGRCTKLSASGLVYRHYGKQVIRAHYPDLADAPLNRAYLKLYDSLLEALDAIDTGVEIVPDGIRAAYRDSTGLSSRVGRLNPRWNEVDETTGDKPCHDDRFEDAVRICGDDFMAVMTAVVESDLPARSHVERAVLQRHDTDPSGEIIAFDGGGLPWKNHLYELEKEHSLDPLVKFVLYRDLSDMWRVQAVTVEGSGFENRLSLPEAWRGVRDEDLEGITQIPGSRFVHAAGFIGGANTYDGVLKMAKAALDGRK